MDGHLTITCTIGLILLVDLLALDGQAQETGPGGYSTTSVTSKQVIAAANFAVEAQKKAIQKKSDEASAKLELVSIQAAEQQVVSGMNYRLKLKVKLNGEEKTAEAIVWWQAWRRPDPYHLTSWHWE